MDQVSTLFCNPKWLHGIDTRSDTAILNTNGGNLAVNQEGTLADYGTVPFHPEGLTNILSLGTLSDRHRIAMDTAVDNAFNVHVGPKKIRFGRDNKNIYSHIPFHVNGQDHAEIVPQAPTSSCTFVQSVEENKLFHTPREQERAKIARDLIASLGSSSVADLKKAISMNAIANLPVSTKDVNLAEKIFGKDLGTLKGKTTRKPPAPMVTDQIEMPPELHDREKWELAVDIMFVNGVPYMASITKALFHRMAFPIDDVTAKNLFAGLDQIFRVCNSNGFFITDIYCDQQFKTLLDEVQDELHATMHASPSSRSHP